MGTLFKQLPQAQIRSKLKTFHAHYEANDETILMSTETVQKSHLGTKLWTFEKSCDKKWVFFLGLFSALEFLKNLLSSLSYGRYCLVPNRGTFWQIFTPLCTFSCFHCFHFHYELFFCYFLSNPKPEARNYNYKSKFCKCKWFYRILGS